MKHPVIWRCQQRSISPHCRPPGLRYDGYRYCRFRSGEGQAAGERENTEEAQYFQLCRRHKIFSFFWDIVGTPSKSFSAHPVSETVQSRFTSGKKILAFSCTMMGFSVIYLQKRKLQTKVYKIHKEAVGSSCFSMFPHILHFLVI